MNADFSSVRAKLARAEEHIYALNMDIKAWVHHNPYRYATEVNEDATRYRVVMRKRGTCEMPTQRWSLLIGDSVHNLRSALDHLVYAIAVHQSGRNPPPHHTTLAFPIFQSPSAFQKFRAKFGSSTLSAAVWAAIESVQPYNRRHPVLPPLLKILSDFDNTDKHRLLKVAYATADQIDVGFCGPEIPEGTRVVHGAYYGEIEDGSEMQSFTFDRPIPNMKYDRINIDMVIAVWHGKRDPSDPEWKDRSCVGAILDALAADVKEVIAVVTAAA